MNTWTRPEPKRPTMPPAPVTTTSATRAESDTTRRKTHLVDPYEMRPEAQPEEPGYGHGV